MQSFAKDYFIENKLIECEIKTITCREDSKENGWGRQNSDSVKVTDKIGIARPLR